MITNIKSNYSVDFNCFEFGCGGGALGSALLQSHLITSYSGCDSSEEACASAQKDGLDVQLSTCESVILALPDSCIKDFNLFIYADVLEHLVDPWAHLKHLHSRIRSGSWLVVSIPCFFHHSNLTSIGNFRFDYEEWGVMDFTHLRHFGLQNIISLLQLTGFSIPSNLPLIPSFDPEGSHLFEKTQTSLPAVVNFGDLSFTIRDINHLLQVCAYQFVLCAQKI
tara:strand:- start:3429 stop:4097 length:669 start_codon:yes stop_codon:yes gene_type:complete